MSIDDLASLMHLSVLLSFFTLEMKRVRKKLINHYMIFITPYIYSLSESQYVSDKDHQQAHYLHEDEENLREKQKAKRSGKINGQ